MRSTKRFESSFADYQGATCARTFWTGRVGIYALLRALGVREKDSVGICAFNSLAVVEAVLRLGARPIFLDVDRHMNISPAALDRLGMPIKALILQHTFGVPCQLEASLAWARQKRVPVLEDCCHALGAMWGDNRIGSFGLASIFSLEFGKPISAGRGGIVAFQDAGLAQAVDDVITKEGVPPPASQTFRLSVRRTVARVLSRPLTRRVADRAANWVEDRGWFSKPDPDLASILGQSQGFLQVCSQGQARAGMKALKRFPRLLDKRMENAAYLQRALADEGIEVLTPPRATMPVYWRLPVWVEGKRNILAQARREHVDIAGWYATPAHPLRGQALLDLQYDPATHPSAEAAFAKVVTLPTYPRLSKPQLENTIRVIKEGSAAQI